MRKVVVPNESLRTDRLHQGDILDVGQVAPILKGHQQYFSQVDLFPYFIVLTQSCDLVPGRGLTFINLVCCRRLRDVLDFDEVRNKKRKEKSEQLVRRLLDYTYDRRGYFYVPDHPGVVEGPCVADLRVIFTLVARHYDALIAARQGGLAELFRTKLGSMAGEMFSRVAVPGYRESWATKNDPHPDLRVATDLVERVLLDEQETFHSLVDEWGKKCQVCACADAVTYKWRTLPQPPFSRQEILACQQCASDLDTKTDSEWPNVEQ